MTYVVLNEYCLDQPTVTVVLNGILNFLKMAGTTNNTGKLDNNETTIMEYRWCWCIQNLIRDAIQTKEVMFVYKLSKIRFPTQ